MIVDIRTTKTYACAAMRGDYVHQDAKDGYVRVIDTAHQHGLLRLLFDFSDVTTAPTMAERLDIGRFGAELRLKVLMEGKSSGFRIATVQKPPILDPQKLDIAETKGRGIVVETFERLEDAVAWLDEEPRG